MGLIELVRANEGVRQLPSTAEFMRIVNCLHNAAHGVDVLQNDAYRAAEISKRFLPTFSSIERPDPVMRLGNCICGRGGPIDHADHLHLLPPAQNERHRKRIGDLEASDPQCVPSLEG
jgi:hypothetical protein